VQKLGQIPRRDQYGFRRNRLGFAQKKTPMKAGLVHRDAQSLNRPTRRQTTGFVRVTAENKFTARELRAHAVVDAGWRERFKRSTSATAAASSALALLRMSASGIVDVGEEQRSPVWLLVVHLKVGSPLTRICGRSGKGLPVLRHDRMRGANDLAPL
jgi:hypothetical protein